MYFLTADERRYISRKLLPEARKMEVHPDLRGWHWSALDAPLRPTYEVPLGVWEVANCACRSGRDVYLRRVLNRYPRPTAEMAEGSILHAFVAAYVTAAKRLFYTIPPA
ncbi:MAG: CRISPR-associated protein Cas4, partial [Chloroflexota bacterium]